MPNNPSEILDNLSSTNRNTREAAQNMLAESARQGYYIVNGKWVQGPRTSADLSTKSTTLTRSAYNNLVKQATGNTAAPSASNTALGGGLTGNPQQDLNAINANRNAGVLPGINTPAPPNTFPITGGNNMAVDTDLYREQFPTELYRQHYGIPSMGLNPYQAWLMNQAAAAQLAWELSSLGSTIPGFGGYSSQPTFAGYLGAGLGTPSQSRQTLGNMWNQLGSNPQAWSTLFGLGAEGTPGGYFYENYGGLPGVMSKISDLATFGMMNKFAPAVASYYGGVMGDLYPQYAANIGQPGGVPTSGNFIDYLLKVAPTVHDKFKIFGP